MTFGWITTKHTPCCHAFIKNTTDKAHWQRFQLPPIAFKQDGYSSCCGYPYIASIAVGTFILKISFVGMGHKDEGRILKVGAKSDAEKNDKSMFVR